MNKKINWNIGQGDFGSVLNRYDCHLRNQSLSEQSVKRYIRYISDFLKFAADAHPTIAQAAEFRETLIERQAAPSSINTTCCAIKQFYSMYGEKYDFKTLA
jgi:site-specific recombinase XerD